MANEIKNVMIIGGAGNLGTAVVPEFQKSKLKLSILTRPESKSTFPSGVNVVRSGYTADAFKGQDAVISLIGGNGFGDQKAIIDAAIEADVKWFLPSEFGSDNANPEVVKKIPFFSAKAQTVDYLKSKEDRMSWTGVACGFFFDWVSRLPYHTPDPRALTGIGSA